jgi:hypothetical protein
MKKNTVDEIRRNRIAIQGYLEQTFIDMSLNVPRIADWLYHSDGALIAAHNVLGYLPQAEQPGVFEMLEVLTSLAALEVGITPSRLQHPAHSRSA